MGIFPNDTDQMTEDIPEADEPVIPFKYKQTEELLKNPKFIKVKKLK